MISSVFGKTKPVNYILVLSFLFVCFILVRFVQFPLEDPILVLPEQLLLVAFLLFSVLAVNFIVQRNQLTGPHSYAIFFFALLAMLFPQTFLNGDAILANFFVILALRRLISIKSLRDTSSKIFDGVFWILVASLFLNWSILFLVLVWAHILLYEHRNLKNWMVPLAAIAAFVLIGTATAYLMGQPQFFPEHYRFEWAGLQTYWADWGLGVRMAAYLLVVLMAGFVAYLKLGKSGQTKILPMRLAFLTLLIALAVIFFGSSEGQSPVLLTFFPSTVFLSKYLETVRRDNLRDGILLGSLALCLVVFLAGWVGK